MAQASIPVSAEESRLMAEDGCGRHVRTEKLQMLELVQLPLEEASMFHQLVQTGANCPRKMNHGAMAAMRGNWVPDASDVFLVSHFRIKGIQCLLTALVEGRGGIWDAPSLIRGERFLERAGLHTGPDINALTEEMASVHRVRRCFKTHSFPHTFPCRYPFQGDATGKTPKVVVLAADPRQITVLWWLFMLQPFANRPVLPREEQVQLGEVIASVISGRLCLFGCFFEHAAAWALEEKLRPNSVRIFSADNLGSQNFNVVEEELNRIAEFLEIPRTRVAELVGNLFSRPTTEELINLQTQYPLASSPDAQLVETRGSHISMFEDVLNTLGAEEVARWKRLGRKWMETGSPLLANLAWISCMGRATEPALALTTHFKGEERHREGKCRPCVFASKGTCQLSAEKCQFCHLDGHVKKQRPPIWMRKRRHEIARLRSPSPTWRSTD